MMIPAWTIRDLDRLRRERLEQERPRPRIEEYVPPTAPAPARPEPGPIVIEP